MKLYINWHKNLEGSKLEATMHIYFLKTYIQLQTFLVSVLIENELHTVSHSKALVNGKEEY